MTEANILFVRRNDGACLPASEDVWDDSALIKAYDKAISLAKEEVSKRLGVHAQHANKQKKSQHKEKQKINKKWHVGSPCRAMYLEDGEFYEATILKICESSKTCVVEFIGYGNTDIIDLSSLLESEGLQSQNAQRKEASESAEVVENVQSFEWQDPVKCNGVADESMECETNEAKTYGNVYGSSGSLNPAFSIMPPAPPLPPQLMARLPENDADALSSMLMSWYISGFHTGYYHGLKESKKKDTMRKK